MSSSPLCTQMWLHWRAWYRPKEDKSKFADAPAETVNASLNCPICMSTLRAPVVGTCGHAVCESCIYQWIGVSDRANVAPRRRGDSRCVTCRVPTAWYSPCHALNSVVSPDALYTNSKPLVTDCRWRDKRVEVDVTVNIHRPDEHPTSARDKCMRWICAPLIEWILRLVILSLGPAIYATTAWIYYAMAAIAAFVGLAWWIKEIRKYPSHSINFGQDALVLAVVALVLCAVAHFLTTVAFWVMPAMTVIGCVYSNTLANLL